MQLFIVLYPLLRCLERCLLALLGFSEELLRGDLDRGPVCACKCKGGSVSLPSPCHGHGGERSTHGALFLTREVDLLSMVLRI